MLTYTQLLRILRSTSFHLKLHLSLVPCKRLFLGTKQITTDRRARLGPVVFEELTIMKCAWSPKLYDVAHCETRTVRITMYKVVFQAVGINHVFSKKEFQ